MSAPRVISEGKTPEQWVEDFAGRGIAVSERELRKRARDLGACRTLGNAMILLPEHIDLIFEVPLCRSNSTFGEADTGAGDTLLMATATSDRALEHLTRQSRKRPSGKSKRHTGNVVSLDPTRQDRKTN